MTADYVMELISNILEEVSDEVGEENIDGGYLIKYEGWGAICLENILKEIGLDLTNISLNIYNEERQEKLWDIIYDFLGAESYKIINYEWKPVLEEDGYQFIDGGFQIGGLYGKTWALFKRNNF